MEELGTVVGFSDDRRIALIRCHKQSACGDCPSTGLCNAGKGDQRQVEALNTIGAQLDDQVKVVVSTSHFLYSSFVLYILPVIGLLAGAIGGHYLAVRSFLTADPALSAAMVGVLGMGLSFVAIRRLTSRLQRERFMPEIVAILDAADNR